MVVHQNRTFSLWILSHSIVESILYCWSTVWFSIYHCSLSPLVCSMGDTLMISSYNVTHQQVQRMFTSRITRQCNTNSHVVLIADLVLQVSNVLPLISVALPTMLKHQLWLTKISIACKLLVNAILNSLEL